MQTIAQRVALLRELAPGVHSIAEICCGDCSRQYQVYTCELGVSVFHGMDLRPAIMAANPAQGIDCVCGDALAPETLRRFAADEVVFFGPPLSEDRDGHRLLGFDDVRPGYADFCRLLLGGLHYAGRMVCICPNATTQADITRLRVAIRRTQPEINPRLIHHSYTTVTGNDEITELRLNYVELWFSSHLDDRWEVRESAAWAAAEV